MKFPGLGTKSAPAAPAKKKKKSRPGIRRTVTFILALIVAIIVGIAAIIGTAAVSSSPPLFLIAGLVAFLLAWFVGLCTATKSVDPSRIRPVRITAFITAAIVVVGLFVVTTLRPATSDPVRPATVAGQRYWDLPTGSRIAYVHLPAQGTPRPTPVVVLHGGPGVVDLAGEVRFFRPLAADGFDVYLYDQVGTGWSSRLEDPSHYTVQRNIDDLDAIRTAIGAQRMDLVGYSYGGLLAAGYLATHPQQVDRVVFTSPADLDPKKLTASTFGRLSNGQIRSEVMQLARPRGLLTYGLLQVNPQAAHNFADDADMDARFDDLYRTQQPAEHCQGKSLGPKLRGLGYYANEYPQSAAAKPHPDYRPALRKLSTPALVIKGSCDYLSWSSAQGYRDNLKNSTTVYIHNAGHDVYDDQPEQSLSTIRAFLRGGPWPVTPYTGSGAPGDYEGPK